MEIFMSYTVSELTFPSKDGLHNVYAEIYLPADGAVKGIIEIVHGMIDYTARYKNLGEYFTACGYAVAGHHHLGHGKIRALLTANAAKMTVRVPRHGG